MKLKLNDFYVIIRENKRIWIKLIKKTRVKGYYMAQIDSNVILNEYIKLYDYIIINKNEIVG